MIANRPNSGGKGSRRGITLVETLVLITGVAIMLGLCAVMIQLLLRLHADSQARVNSAFVFERLARQLRDDAHSSESARLGALDAKDPDEHTGLTLSMQAAHSISYSVRNHVVARDETLGGKRVRHESYSLPRDHAARFEILHSAGRAMVSLWLTREPGSSRTDPPRPLEVVASLGKHRARPIGTPEGDKP